MGPDGAPVIDPATGQMQMKTMTRRVMEEFDFRQLKHLWFNISVNSGSTTFYSEIAMVQTLDNLRRDGTLEVLDYLERIPDKLIPRKQELIDAIKQRTGMMSPEEELRQEKAQDMAAGTQPPNMAKGSALNSGQNGEGLYAIGGPLDSAKNVAMMPNMIQQKYDNLPTGARNALQKMARLGGT